MQRPNSLQRPSQVNPLWHNSTSAFGNTHTTIGSNKTKTFTELQPRSKKRTYTHKPQQKLALSMPIVTKCFHVIKTFFILLYKNTLQQSPHLGDYPNGSTRGNPSSFTASKNANVLTFTIIIASLNISPHKILRKSSLPCMAQHVGRLMVRHECGSVKIDFKVFLLWVYSYLCKWFMYCCTSPWWNC